jgi:predicted RNA-binding Zn ribbon-like protein
MAASTMRTFELVAGHAALDFVNTLDWRFREGNPEELLGSYGDLLGFMEQAELLTPKQVRQIERTTSVGAATRVLKECKELREALADIFYGHLDGHPGSTAALATLERSFKASRAHQKLVGGRSRVRWDWAGMETEPDFPLWLLALRASELMLSDDAVRVRACDSIECRWLFLDTSKNHTRRWCDMKICGNRMKARRFKAQRRG